MQNATLTEQGEIVQEGDRQYRFNRYAVNAEHVREGDSIPDLGAVAKVEPKAKWTTIEFTNGTRKRVENETQFVVVRKVETDESMYTRLLRDLVESLPGEIDKVKQAAIDATAKVAEQTAEGYSLSWSYMTDVFEKTARWEAVYAPLHRMINDDDNDVADPVERTVNACRWLVDRMKSDMLEYRLGGSTNPVSNLIEDAQRAAKAEALRSWGSSLIRIVQFADEAGI